ncbi:MAG: hypothetical protein WC877_01885 [Dehalococcoidales bacterium]|jgi:inorganic pyrophosphatase
MALIKPFFKNPDEYTDIEDLRDYVKHLIEIYNSLIDEYNDLEKKNIYLEDRINGIIRVLDNLVMLMKGKRSD